MKLRVRGNTIRLRLTRGEVAKLAGEGAVSERCQIARGASLGYAIERGGDVVGASFEGGLLRVTAPAATVERWASSEDVGFEATVPVEGDVTLKVLVEKDWQCLTKRPGEEDVDTYPHPHETC